MKTPVRTALALGLAGLLALPAALAAASPLPAPRKIVLKNGLTVYHLRNADVPLVSLRMFIGGAGSAAEPASAEGVAGLTAALLMKGTSKMGADAIAEALDFMGATFGIGASEEYAQVYGDSLTQHFPRLLEIAAAVLSDPAFAADEFEKERSLRIDGLKAAKDNPGAAVRYYFQKAYFGDHPMGHLASGTETSLGRMTVQAVKDFYRKSYRPDRAIAAVVGDIDAAALQALLEKTLGRLANPAGPAAAAAVPALPRPQGRDARPRRQAGRDPSLLLAGRAGLRHGRQDHGRGLGHEHALRRPVHLLAQHRAADQAGPDLRRLERGPHLGRRRASPRSAPIPRTTRSARCSTSSSTS